MSMRSRAKAFHGGYWVETSHPTRASIFTFAYATHGGTLYVVRRGIAGKPILKHFVGR